MVTDGQAYTSTDGGAHLTGSPSGLPNLADCQFSSALAQEIEQSTESLASNDCAGPGRVLWIASYPKIARRGRRCSQQYHSLKAEMRCGGAKRALVVLTRQTEFMRSCHCRSQWFLP